MAGDFDGFSPESLSFLARLRDNNDKAWFEAHRDEFERFIVEPARHFVVSLGERLKKIQPGLTADPRTNGSIFRIYRDTRFSKDKSPYKSHVGMFFWEGPGSKMDNPGFYVHFEDGFFLAGEGLYMFPRRILDAYREAVARPGSGEELAGIVRDAADRGYEVGGLHYKRVPRGYDPDHPRAELLRHNGLHVGRGGKPPGAFFSGELVSYCERIFRDMLPLHRWMLRLTDDSSPS